MSNKVDGQWVLKISVQDLNIPVRCINISQGDQTIDSDGKISLGKSYTFDRSDR